MKQFWDKKPLITILKDAKFKEFSIDTTSYNEGGDFVWFVKNYDGDLLSVGYNTFNGQFLGNYWTIEFFSNNAIHDNEPRMNELFDLFYLPLKNNENN